MRFAAALDALALACPNHDFKVVQKNHRSADTYLAGRCGSPARPEVLVILPYRQAAYLRWPDSGVTPFGWWLHCVWIEKIPRIVFFPGGWQVVTLKLYDSGIMSDVYIARHLSRFFLGKHGLRWRFFPAVRLT